MATTRSGSMGMCGVPIRSSGAMMRYGFRRGGRSVMVISWRPSKFGVAVLTSMMTWNDNSTLEGAVNSYTSNTLSAICMISGLAPTLAPGMMPPSSVIALASTIATSNLLFSLCNV